MSLKIKYEDIYYAATDYCCFTLVVTILLSLLFLKPDLVKHMVKNLCLVVVCINVSTPKENNIT